MTNNLVKEKINQAAGILNEKEIDMWITFVRESSVNHDPVLEIIADRNFTWQTAIIICRNGDTAVITGSLEEKDVKESGYYKYVEGYLQSIKGPLVDYVKRADPKTIALNFSRNSNLADGLSYGMYQMLTEYFQNTPYASRFVSSESIISTLKGRKSPAEIAIISEAIVETEKIFDEVTRFIKPGVSEIEIANFVKEITFSKGFGLAWEEDHCPAVFTGPDASGAHSGPTNNKVEKGHIVNMDFGIKFKGYCSDLQRMWYVLKDDEKEAPAEVQKGFEIIRDAIQMTAKEVKPGVLGCNMDDIARNYITGLGYDEYQHGLGHQVGRNVHDGGSGLYPRWERYGNAPYIPFEKDQVYTIEPRLPVKNYGTSTLEEMIVVTETGCKFLSDTQNDLILI